MQNQPATREDVKEVVRKLGSIEEKLKGDKGHPLVVAIIVAIITAIATTISTCITNRKQEEVKAELASRLEQYGELGKQIAGKQVDFFSRAISLLSDIDRSFMQVCYLTPTKQAEEKLTEALDKYQQLLSQTTAEIANENIKTQMIKYSSSILDKLSIIKSGASDQQKANLYKESQKILKETREQLNSLLSRR